MRDVHLGELVAAHHGPFPRGLGGREIEGIDLVTLDAGILGIASHYEGNSRPLRPEHRTMLQELLANLDRIWPGLPSDEARDFFGSSRKVAAYILAAR